MSRLEKAKERIRIKPKDYTYSEAKTLLSQLGFEEYNKGKTSGSRVKFYRKEDKKIILLHKPHPGDVMTTGAIRELADFLSDLGEVWRMKKSNVIEYKGYHTKIEFDANELLLRGKIEGINDLVNFECKDINDVEKEFQDAVDDYLEFCKEVGKEPDKEYKGTFNVRISPELHKKISHIAIKNEETLNATVEKAIKEYIYKFDRTEKFLEGSIRKSVKGLRNESTYEYPGIRMDRKDNLYQFGKNMYTQDRKEM